jgi:hypothetical protein
MPPTLPRASLLRANPFAIPPRLPPMIRTHANEPPFPYNEHPTLLAPPMLPEYQPSAALPMPRATPRPPFHPRFQPVVVNTRRSPIVYSMPPTLPGWIWTMERRPGRRGRYGSVSSISDGFVVSNAHADAGAPQAPRSFAIIRVA